MRYPIVAAVAVAMLWTACSSDDRPGPPGGTAGSIGGSSDSGSTGGSAGAAGSGGSSLSGAGGSSANGGSSVGGSAGVGGSAAGGGAAGTSGSAGSGGSADRCAPGDSRRVLFIGNSYTAANNLPQLVTDLAASAGCLLATENRTPGGARFVTHAGNASTLAVISSEPWHAVVLQNQSQVPAWPAAQLLAQSVPHAQTLVTEAEKNEPDPRTIYFVTWGRRDGDAMNCGSSPQVCTFEGHTDALLAGYTLYRDTTGGELAPVGAAWAAVYADPNAPFPAADLWSGDGSHPSLRGSYLAAAVMYATIYNDTPLGLTFTAGLPQNEAAYLQIMAAVAIESTSN